jgi:hypothetical protein
MRVYVSLIMLSGVLGTGFLASYWTAVFGRFLQVSAVAYHWLEDFTPTPEKNDQYRANNSKCNASSKPTQFYQ